MLVIVFVFFHVISMNVNSFHLELDFKWSVSTQSSGGAPFLQIFLICMEKRKKKHIRERETRQEIPIFCFPAPPRQQSKKGAIRNGMGQWVTETLRSPGNTAYALQRYLSFSFPLENSPIVCGLPSLLKCLARPQGFLVLPFPWSPKLDLIW